MIYLVKSEETFSDKLSIQLPFSKSISNRALIISALSGSSSKISNISHCDDTDVMCDVLSSAKCDFNIGAAGTAMRFLTAFLSTKEGIWTLTGSERMKQRPIAVLVSALRQLGAKIDYIEKEGYPPLRIEGGKLNGGTISLPGDVSSQYISALLMIAPTLAGGLKLKLVGEIISCSYIKMTLAMMRSFGVNSTFEGDSIEVPCQCYQCVDYSVEADWSAASYWYEVCALSPRPLSLQLPHLYEDSLQGDSAIATLFAKLGVSTSFEGGVCTLRSSGRKDLPECFCHNFSNQPDVAQTFAVTCCCLGVKFVFSGLRTLRIKETDRIAALLNECAKLGFNLRAEGDDTLIWSGELLPRSDASISTYKDHRMAMSFAPAAIALGSVKIEDPMVVTKSYPDFWKDLSRIVKVLEISNK